MNATGRIDVTLVVYEAAKKLETLEGLRDFSAYDFTQIVAGFHKAALDENIKGDPDDPHWSPIRRQEIEFWEAVADYLMAREVEDAGVASGSYVHPVRRGGLAWFGRLEVANNMGRLL